MGVLPTAVAVPTKHRACSLVISTDSTQLMLVFADERTKADWLGAIQRLLGDATAADAALAVKAARDATCKAAAAELAAKAKTEAARKAADAKIASAKFQAAKDVIAAKAAADTQVLIAQNEVDKAKEDTHKAHEAAGGKFENAVCTVCGDTHSGYAVGVLCNTKPDPHFTCAECFRDRVGVVVSDPDATGGKVCCCTTSDTFDAHVIARFLTKEEYAAYAAMVVGLSTGMASAAPLLPGQTLALERVKKTAAALSDAAKPALLKEFKSYDSSFSTEKVDKVLEFVATRAELHMNIPLNKCATLSLPPPPPPLHTHIPRPIPRARRRIRPPSPCTPGARGLFTFNTTDQNKKWGL